MLDEEGTIRVEPHGLFPGEEAYDTVREQIERAIKRLEQLQERFSDQDPINSLREEMRSLRQEVEKLRQREQPSDPAATDSRDA